MSFLGDDSVALQHDQRTKLSPGFIAFLGLMFLPAIAALVIFAGAWLVSGDVYAAQSESSPVTGDRAASSAFPAQEVAGWKRALVAVCPVH